MAKLDSDIFTSKLPKLFIGGIVGIVLGYIFGTLFGDIGAVASIAWDKVFVFFGAIFGALAGYNLE